MACQQNHIPDDSAYSAALYPLLLVRLMPQRFLTNYAEQIVSNDGQFQHHINNTHTDRFCLSTLNDILHIFPGRPDINCLSLSGIPYILAAFLNQFEPFVLCFTPAKIAFYYELVTVFQENTQILLCIISGVHTNQQLLIRHFVA